MREDLVSTQYVVGVDFGTLSGRALLVRVDDGAEIATAVYTYPHGVIESSLPETGERLPPDWALQVPEDYVGVLKNAVPQILSESGIDPNSVIGIATDFTACTVLPVDSEGRPLNEYPNFSTNPHSYVKLWKHHSAQKYADRINRLASQRGESWLVRYGGKISSEWEFAKGLQLLEEAPEVYAATRHWIEAADWIVWQLCGNYVRNICTAGFKGIYQDGSYPSEEYLSELNPKFSNFVKDKIEHPLGQLGASAGRLTSEAAKWTGLPEGISVAVGNVDAHATAAAANALLPGRMVAIMGTSTCLVMVGDRLKDVPGMCGVVEDGIISNALGYEAGQSGVGDIFGWFVEHFTPDGYKEIAEKRGISIHELFSELSMEKRIGGHGLIALDWENGNRSTLVDHELSGLILGLTLSTKAEDVYRALLESTAYGCRKIVEAFNESGVQVKEFIVAGGLVKNQHLMQIYADVLNLPIFSIKSDQGSALGAAIHAAVAAGAYADVQSAASKMGGVSTVKFLPISSSVIAYEEMYQLYSGLYNEFGHNGIMHSLRSIRDRRQLDPEIDQ